MIRDNFRPSDRLAIVLLNKRTGHVLQRVATADKISEERYQAWLRHQNAGRYEVYVSMNTLKPGAQGRTKAEIQDVRHVYLDLDEGGQAKLEALLCRADIPQPNWVLQSSPGKFQVVWKVDRVDIAQAEGMMRCLVDSTGADPAATDVSRVLRLPGFRNHKYGGAGHLVTASRFNGEIREPGEFPSAILDATTPRKNSSATRDMRVAAGRLSQSEKDWAYAKRALRRGDPVHVAIRAIEEYRRGDKSSPQYYARHTVEKAARSFTNELPTLHSRS